jgi:predicted amidohydrolase YtcJ
MRCRLLLILFVLAFSVSCITGQDESVAPDTVLINGKILTVDPEDSIAEAVAIKDGLVVAVDTNEAITNRIGPQTKVIDLNGSTATPGLIDSHCHFSGTGMLYVLDLGYPAVKSVAEVVDKVSAQAEQLEPGEWIRGRGWDEGKFTELRYIDASDLDPVSPDHPVWLSHTMGHYGTANSAALKMANITKDTPDPPGGTIDRAPDGTPTGVLKESAQGLVSRHIPDYTLEQRQRGIIKIVEEFNKEGMTAVKDAGVGEEKWQAYRNVLAEGKLNVRVFVLWDSGETIESTRDLIDRVAATTKPYRTTGDDRLVSGGIKIYLDGSGGARTAWLYEPWNKNYEEIDEGNFGYPVIDPELFRDQVLLFHEAGLHVSTHAIGDRAIDWVMDTYAMALEKRPTHGLRHGIIHANIPTDRAIDLMAEMQRSHDAGYPESQSTFTWWIGDTYAGNFGPERARRLMPFQTYLDKGVIWGGSADFSVTPFPARYGLWASIARKPLLGTYGNDPYGTDESVDIHAALRSYTIWNARQLFMEDKIGSIEVGKYADIAIWDKDLYTVPVEEIKDIECQMTLLGGEVVYQAPQSLPVVSSSDQK